MWHNNIKVHVLKNKLSSLYENYLEKYQYITQQKQKTFTVATEIM